MKMKFAVCFLFFYVAVAECAVVTLPSAADPGVKGASIAPAADSAARSNGVEELVELGLLVDRVGNILEHLDEDQSSWDEKVVPYGFWSATADILKNAAKQAAKAGKQAVKEAVAKKVEELLDTKVRDIVQGIAKKRN